MCVFVSAVGDEVCQQGGHIVCLLCVMCSYIVHKIGDTLHTHSNNMRERSVLVSSFTSYQTSIGRRTKLQLIITDLFIKVH